jgi:hypothetical protein
MKNSTRVDSNSPGAVLSEENDEVCMKVAAVKSALSIYYLPGRNETCREHVGAVLSKAGLTYKGRDMTGDFLRRPFSMQVGDVAEDLEKGFIGENSLILGRSYGGYLLLHAVCEIGSYPGKVLLFNPVLGRYFNESNLCGIIPPRADKLLSLARQGKFPPIRSFVIVSGEEDTQCPTATAGGFIQALAGNARLIVLRGQGHGVDETTLPEIVMDFLNEDYSR